MDAGRQQAAACWSRRSIGPSSLSQLEAKWLEPKWLQRRLEEDEEEEEVGGAGGGCGRKEEEEPAD